jgi:hypothetical protein
VELVDISASQKRDYMKTIFNELETNSMKKKTRLVEGINYSKEA